MPKADTPYLTLLVGSQHLYGPEPLREVERNGQAVASALSDAHALPCPVTFGGVLTTAEAILRACQAADADPRCAGLVLWMHTFSPSKLWIAGLAGLRKPFLHLHTQFHRDLPWATIDMDFMNLHQAAHGDREAGFLHTRLRSERKVIAGHWADPSVQARIGAWARSALAWREMQQLKVARFGDNMRQVAVTEGDKVAAQVRLGITVDGFGIGDLVARVEAVPDQAVTDVIETYRSTYDVAPALGPGGERHASLRHAARVELGLRSFLDEGGYRAFTTTFEDLHGLEQLPGFAAQRLMADGYGFGAEGDWKTAALLRALKVLAADGPGGTSFMEDYTYDLGPDGPRVLGSHMLEVCPSIAAVKPRVEIHPLGIGGKGDPVRLVFDAKTGPALNVSLVDLGSRFRLVVNEVDAVPHPELPRLPVARAVWTCRPDFATAAEAWIYAGGAHHTVFSYDLGSDHIVDLGAMAGVEVVVIDTETRLRSFRDALRFADLTYALRHGLGD
ncbi:MAG: L-arabinose isomerase [Trueperaceae bacterium]